MAKQNKLNQTANKICYYTDGSLLRNQKGRKYSAFAYIQTVNNRIISKYVSPVERHSTNNIMEMKAVIFACKDAVNTYGESEDIYIYTDSAYIYNCANNATYKKWQDNGWKTSKGKSVDNKEYWLQLIPFFQNERIHICKCKAHTSGNIMNTYVNNLAQNTAIESAYGE